MAEKKPAIVDEAIEQPESQPPVAEEQAMATAEQPEQEGAETEAPDTEEAGDVDEASESAEDARTPEEQAQFEKIVTAAYKLMYSKTGFAVLLKKLQEDRTDVAYNYGHTLAMIMLSIQNAARAKGNSFDPAIIFEAGLEVLQDLMKIGDSSGMIRKEFSDKVATRALFVALKVYGDAEIRAGNITSQDMVNAKNEIASLGLDPEAAQEATGAKRQASIEGHAKSMMQEHPPGTGLPQEPQQPAPAGGIVNQAAGV